MLASVADVLEVETVISAGADIVDLKNPLAGALGALPIEQLRRMVSQVARRRPVSATIGDLPPHPSSITDAIVRTAASGVDYVKVGFFSSVNLRNCLQAVAGITADHAVIAVLFADRRPPLQRIREFADAGFQGIMLDTADKRTGQLLQHVGRGDLGRFVEDARRLGLLSGLAGSLRLQDIPRLLPLQPDYLGFRGALCAGRNRVEAVDPIRVSAIRTALSCRTAAVGSSQAASVNP